MNKAIKQLEKEIKSGEEALYQVNVDLENLRCIQEEKEESLRMATRAVMEEDKKLERAKNIVERCRTEIKETAPRSLVEYELDMNVRIQRDKQQAAVAKLRDIGKYDEQIGYAVNYLLNTLEIGQPSNGVKSAAKKRTKSKSKARDPDSGDDSSQQLTTPDVSARYNNLMCREASKNIFCRRESEAEPKWQVGFDRPRLM